MKNLTFVSAAVIALVCATAFADGFTPTPVPFLGAPVGQTALEPMAVAPPAAAHGELFKCVRYKDTDKIPCCAVPMIVQIKDPCACHDPCNCCAPVKCVSVKICVPKSCPCDCPPKVTCSKDGSKVKYDFGKFEVELTSRKGEVVVDYDN